MIRSRLLPNSIVTKLIMMNALIFVAVGGVIIVNLALSHQTRNTIITLVDKDVPQLIHNQVLSRNLNQVTADIHLLVSTFTLERDVLSSEAKRILPILQDSILSAGNTQELNRALRHFTQAVENVLNQCAKIDDLSKTIKSIENKLVALTVELEATSTEAIIARKLEGRDYELFSFEQVSALIPDFRNMLLRVSGLLSDSERAHFKREETKINYEEQILALLRDLESGLAAVTTGGEKLAPFGKALIGNVHQYKNEIASLHQTMREIQATLGVLYSTQSEVMAIIMAMDKSITLTMEQMRKKVVEHFRSSGNITLVLSLLVVAVLIGVSVYGVKIAKPLQSLAVSASEIAAGKLERKIEISGDDEIGVLARSFIKMRDAIKEKMDDFTQKNEELLREILKHKRTAEALQESEEKYRLLIKSLPSIVYRGHPDWSVEFIDNKVELLTGYDVGEFNSRKVKWLSLIVEEDFEAAGNSFSQALKTDRSYVREYRIKSKTGEIHWLQDRGHIVCNENGDVDYISGVFFDITETKKLETQLQQSQKMESIGTLAGGIAHDFNNILAAVIGYTEIALDDVKENKALYNNLQQVLKAGERAKDLVKQILTFSRQTDQELQPVQVQKIAREALKLLRATLPTTIEIKHDIQNESTVLADPTQLHQVLMNICTNASHAMQEKGGILEISINNVELNLGFTLNYPDLKPGPYLKMTIKDTGHGMPPEVLERIFDPFYTTKEKGEGTGMGLSVVHGIVKSHGGTITVYSEPHKGSTFNVYLPVIGRDISSEIITEKLLPTGTERILFVDDEQAIVHSGRLILESLGYEVVTKTSSIEALELFKLQKDRFELVITDMTMPRMTGENLAKELMNIRPDIPVVLCTGFSAKIDKTKAMSLGIRAFISKPILKRELAEIIRAILDG